jgi:hypothetical protein
MLHLFGWLCRPCCCLIVSLSGKLEGWTAACRVQHWLLQALDRCCQAGRERLACHWKLVHGCKRLS